MIEYVFGSRGSGKTKRMVDMADEELKKTDGSILFINDREHYRSQINYQIRFINIDLYKIKGLDELYGFICGLLASNYDITAIYLDNLLRIIDAKSLDDVKLLIDKLEKLDFTRDIRFVLSISAEKDDAPDFMRQN